MSVVYCNCAINGELRPHTPDVFQKDVIHGLTEILVGVARRPGLVSGMPSRKSGRTEALDATLLVLPAVALPVKLKVPRGFACER